MTIDSTLPRDRTAVVTGAASERGIGRAIATKLAGDGWNVAILDIDETGARTAAAALAQSSSVDVRGFGVDITDPTHVARAFDSIRAAMPPVLGVVNNAGVSSPVPFLDVDEREWRRMFEVNVHGAFHVTKQAVSSMVEHHVGRIIFVSSTSAERGGGVYGRAAYSGSKAALLGIGRTLARELGPHGITVNCVAPGSIDTDIMGGPLTDEGREALVKDLLVGRIGTVRDVAALVSFLMDESASYITGVTYDVNGGSHIA